MARVVGKLERLLDRVGAVEVLAYDSEDSSSSLESSAAASTAFVATEAGRLIGRRPAWRRFMAGRTEATLAITMQQVGKKYLRSD